MISPSSSLYDMIIGDFTAPTQDFTFANGEYYGKNNTLISLIIYQT